MTSMRRVLLSAPSESKHSKAYFFPFQVTITIEMSGLAVDWFIRLRMPDGQKRTTEPLMEFEFPSRLCLPIPARNSFPSGLRGTQVWRISWQAGNTRPKYFDQNR